MCTDMSFAVDGGWLGALGKNLFPGETTKRDHPQRSEQPELIGEKQMETRRTNIFFPDLVVVAHQKGKESTPESGLKTAVCLPTTTNYFFAETRDGERLGWNGARPIRTIKLYMWCMAISGSRVRETRLTLEQGDTFVVRGWRAAWRVPAIEDSRVVDVFHAVPGGLQSVENAFCRIV